MPFKQPRPSRCETKTTEWRKSVQGLKTWRLWLYWHALILGLKRHMIRLVRSSRIRPWSFAVANVRFGRRLCRRIWCGWRVQWCPSAIGLHRKLFSPQKLQPESVWTSVKTVRPVWIHNLRESGWFHIWGHPHFHGWLNSCLLETRASLTTPVSHIGGLVFFFARTCDVFGFPDQNLEVFPSKWAMNFDTVQVDTCGWFHGLVKGTTPRHRMESLKCLSSYTPTPRPCTGHYVSVDGLHEKNGSSAAAMEIDGALKVGSSFRFWKRWPAGFCNPRPSRRWRAWLSLRLQRRNQARFWHARSWGWKIDKARRLIWSKNLNISGMHLTNSLHHSEFSPKISGHMGLPTFAHQYVRLELPECSECSQAAVVIGWPSMGPKMSQCLTLIDSSTHRCCRGFSGDYRRSCSSVAGLEVKRDDRFFLVFIQVGITDVVTVHGNA